MHGTNTSDHEPGFGFERFAENTADDMADNATSTYQEGWVISYIDIMTLLLTMFVILLAMSHFKPDNSASQQFTADVSETEKQLPQPVSNSSESKRASGLDAMQKEHKAEKHEEGQEQIQGYQITEYKISSVTLPAQALTIPKISAAQSDAMYAEEKSESVLEATDTGMELIDMDVMKYSPYQLTSEKHQYFGAAKLFSNKIDAARILPVQTSFAESDDEIEANEQIEKSAFLPDHVLAKNHQQDMTPLSHEPISELMRKINNSRLAHQIEISEAQDRLNLVISDHILFAQGSANLKPEGLELLGQLAEMINATSLNISVEGHTDNVPINNAHFPSNWELSTARATRVTRHLIGNDIAPQRIRAIGYADTRPRADNKNTRGREHNRRVLIILHLPEAGDIQLTRNSHQDDEPSLDLWIHKELSSVGNTHGYSAPSENPL